MSFEEQFDKILNNKLNESDFPFDENNWEKAKNLIEANRVVPTNKSKNLLFFGLAFIGILSLGVFAYFQLNNTASNVVVVTNNTYNDKNSNLQSFNDEGKVTSNTLVENSNTKIINLNNNNLKAEIVNDKKSALNLKQETSNAIIENKNTSSETNNSNVTETNSYSETTNSKNKSESTNSNTNKNTTNSLPTNTSSNNSQNKLIAINSNNAINGNRMGNYNFKNKSFQKNNTKISSKINPIISKKENNSDEVRKDDKNLEITSTNEELLIYQPLNSKGFGINQTQLNNECKPTNANVLAIYDNDYYKNTKSKFNFLNIEVGTTYLLGWNSANNNSKDAVGLNYYAGLNYGIYINPKTSISAGIQGFNISNIKQSFYTATKTLYDFGSTGSFTNIITNSMYYVAIPIKINYALSPISKIGLGVNTAFLVGGRNTIESYNLFDGVKTNATSTTNKGYYEGVNTKNITLSALYTRKLTKRFALNGEFMYGLSDVYINTKNNVTKQNTVGFKLGLIITLLDK